MKNLKGEQILSLRMKENDADADTIREYLKALLTGLWEGGESFSGKRPFGNSGWNAELAYSLVFHEVIEGEMTDYGNGAELSDWDDDELFQSIQKAIDAL